MTNLLARILLSIMILPLAAVIYLTILFSLRRGYYEHTFLAATVVTAVFIAFYWLVPRMV